jgi:hypothetical protein
LNVLHALTNVTPQGKSERGERKKKREKERKRERKRERERERVNGRNGESGHLHLEVLIFNCSYQNTKK